MEMKLIKGQLMEDSWNIILLKKDKHVPPLYIPFYFFKITGVDDKWTDLMHKEKALISKRELSVCDLVWFYFAVWSSQKVKK